MKKKKLTEEQKKEIQDSLMSQIQNKETYLVKMREAKHLLTDFTNTNGQNFHPIIWQLVCAELVAELTAFLDHESGYNTMRTNVHKQIDEIYMGKMAEYNAQSIAEKHNTTTERVTGSKRN